MQMLGISFSTTDWSKIEQTEHKGERGFAYWRTQHFGSIRVRMVILGTLFVVAYKKVGTRSPAALR